MGNTQKRLYLQIAQQLADSVIRGEVKVGERFPSERDLVQKYNVSRSTIREAMIALEVNQLVEIRLGSGIYALEPQANKMAFDSASELPGPFEILESRLILEAQAAKIAAERISNQELHELKQLISAMEQAADDNNVEQAEQLDKTFHLTIMRATRNNALMAMYEWLWRARETSRINKQFHHKLRKQNSEAVSSEHKAILTALMQKDGEAARIMTETHLKAVEKRLATDSFS